MPTLTTPPTGTVTFLFTDIEGSTKFWEQNPTAMSPARARHDVLLRDAIETSGGYVFKTVGDGFCAAFPTVPEALQAAHAAQIALANEIWETETAIRVRMALHTGAAEEQDGDYFGPPLNRVARLMGAGHGGQILLSAATQELTHDTLPASASLLDLGSHRLRDLGRPETVFQLLHPSLPADFPPLRSLDNPDLPNNLPQQVTSFVGRETQVAEVKGLLNRTRLLTLTGSGGSGKTRLSLQVAADLLDGAGDGVWLVELAALSDPAIVPQAVANVLGIKEEPGKGLQQTLVAALNAKRLLIVLDNCEHLIAACASLAADLLRGCPNVHILASSREALNVAGEQTYRVPSLSLPDPKKTQTVESLSLFEAVRLFIERAQAVQPSFAVTNGNVPAVAQVCWRLDGIPLALELAAARVRSLPVEQINTRLDQRFRLLTGGSRNALPRQQTLQALIDWSYDLLTAEEKMALCRLAVFAGGWTVEVAERVITGEGLEGEGIEDFEVLDLLTSLVDKSLVVYEEQGNGAARYRLLESVRQYGQERLAETGAGAEMGRRHRDYFLQQVERSKSDLEWLKAERDNLRAALTFSLEAQEGAEAAQRLGIAMFDYWLKTGELAEGRAWLERVLEKEGESGSPKRMQTLHATAFLAMQQAGFIRAEALARELLSLAKQLGDERWQCIGLAILGHVCNDLKEAQGFIEQELAIQRHSGYEVGIANALSQLGLCLLKQGEPRLARLILEEAMALAKKTGSSGTIKEVRGWMALLSRAEGDWEAARTYWEEELASERERNENVAFLLRDLGAVYIALGDLNVARAMISESVPEFELIGNPFGLIRCLEGLAQIIAAQGQSARAVSVFGAAERQRETHNMPLPPLDRSDYNAVPQLRATLGEEFFTIAWAEGQVMTLDQAVAYALANE